VVSSPVALWLSTEKGIALRLNSVVLTRSMSSLLFGVGAKQLKSLGLVIQR
jgi:hypothetical protein